jgi:dCMP deaminase
MKAAFVYADLSYCKRKKVGCVIVTQNGATMIGYNGTPSGDKNECEGEDGLTLPHVIHAEDNALRKFIKSTESSVGASVFVTAAPCERCAEKLSDAKVAKVYYSEIYGGHTQGLVKLAEKNIETELLEQE